MMSRIALLGALCACVVLVGGAAVAVADTTPQSLPFAQDWTNTGLITTNDDWSGVPGIVGYLGQDITTSTGVDPQTLLTESAVANDVDVIANQTNTAITNGGVAEFELANPTVALQGSGTADAPYLLFSVNTLGLSSITVSYNLRDIDGTTDNAVQPVALQYRVGATGSFTNVPAGYVADATTGPSLATLVTPVTAALPADAADKALVQVRVITSNAVGSDEWVGVDDISIISGAGDAAPSVQATSPANGASNVPLASNIDITFSEPVDVTGTWFTISCGTSGSHTAVVSGGPTTFTLNPDSDFVAGESCMVTVLAANVTDQDTDDPPNNMAANHVFSFTTPPVPTTGVVVSEVYGGGGNSGATYSNDFIELYNATASPVSLAGWSVQYASSAGTTWAVTNLGGTIAPGGNYLVQEAAGAGGDLPLPGPDATGSTAMSATSGKVALVSSTSALSGSCPTGGAIVDFVGYGTANCSETAPTGTLSNTTSAQRKGGGATDTDNNANDFDIGDPAPRGTTDPAPAVLSTTPAGGTTDVGISANITINFSEPVSAAGSWFTISCLDSGLHTAAVSANAGSYRFMLDPDTDFGSLESCTVTIHAAQVSDLDTFDPPDAMAADYMFSFTTADASVCGDPATLIQDVQGSGAASPIVGSSVAIEGIVVGDFQAAGAFGGFFVQEEDAQADADPATSEGIFVFHSATDVSVGDHVRVRGTVAEFNGLTELTGVNAVSVCSTGNPLPALTEVELPTDLEPYEGMRVRLTQTLVISEYFNYDRFGELVLALPLAGESRPFTPTAVEEPGPSALARLTANLARRITLDDGLSIQNPSTLRHPNGDPFSLSNRFRGGDTVQNTVGVLDFQFGLYRIQPTAPAAYTAVNPRPAAPEPVGGTLRVAAMNTLNFFVTADYPTGDPNDNKCGPLQNVECRGWDSDQPTEFMRQRDKLLQALAGLDADVLGLNELENTTGVEPLQSIVSGLPGYAYIDTGTIGTDAIKVGLIYKPAKVTPVGPYKLLTSAVDPRFIDTKSRPVLAQTFEENATGARFTVAVNHLKSKGSDCNDVGDPDVGDGQGNCNLTRTAAAQALVDWLATDPTGSGDPDFLIVGDLNSYAMEDPVDAIKAGPDDLLGTADDYTNLVQQFVGTYAYSYVFDGQAGYLDHALSSASLTSRVTGITEWHINADEPDVLDYDTTFKPPEQDALYEPNAYRTSDHDPVVIGLELQPTFARVCELTRAYVTSAKVADQLCRYLEKAEQAAADGKLKKKQEELDKYVKEVRKEIGITITQEQAEFLIGLAGGL